MTSVREALADLERHVRSVFADGTLEVAAIETREHQSGRRVRTSAATVVHKLVRAVILLPARLWRRLTSFIRLGS